MQGRSDAPYCTAALTCILASRPVLSTDLPSIPIYAAPIVSNDDAEPTVDPKPDVVLQSAPTVQVFAAQPAKAQAIASSPTLASKDVAPSPSLPQDPPAEEDHIEVKPQPNVRNKALQEALKRAREGRLGTSKGLAKTQAISVVPEALDEATTQARRPSTLVAHADTVPQIASSTKGPATSAAAADPILSSSQARSFFAALKSRFEPPPGTDGVATAAVTVVATSPTPSRSSTSLSPTAPPRTKEPAKSPSATSRIALPVQVASSSPPAATTPLTSPLLKAPVSPVQPRSLRSESFVNTVPDTPAFQRRMQREFEKLAATVGEDMIEVAVPEDVEGHQSDSDAREFDVGFSSAKPAIRLLALPSDEVASQVMPRTARSQSPDPVTKADAKHPSQQSVLGRGSASAEAVERPGSRDSSSPPLFTAQPRDDRTTPAAGHARQDSTWKGRIIVGRLGQQGGPRKIKALTVPVAPAFAHIRQRAPREQKEVGPPPCVSTAAMARPRQPLRVISKQPAADIRAPQATRAVKIPSGLAAQVNKVAHPEAAKAASVMSRPAKSRQAASLRAKAPIPKAAAPSVSLHRPTASRPTGVHKRTMPDARRTSNTAGLSNPFEVEPIARKPSSVVQIPDFAAAHRAAEAKRLRILAGGKSKLTHVEAGKTPGRTSRMRMQERAEYDAQNQEYHRQREAARQAFLAEQEVCLALQGIYS